MCSYWYLEPGGVEAEFVPASRAQMLLPSELWAWPASYRDDLPLLQNLPVCLLWPVECIFGASISPFLMELWSLFFHNNCFADRVPWVGTPHNQKCWEGSWIGE